MKPLMKPSNLATKFVVQGFLQQSVLFHLGQELQNDGQHNDNFQTLLGKIEVEEPCTVTTDDFGAVSLDTLETRSPLDQKN